MTPETEPIQRPRDGDPMPSFPPCICGERFDFDAVNDDHCPHCRRSVSDQPAVKEWLEHAMCSCGHWWRDHEDEAAYCWQCGDGDGPAPSCLSTTKLVWREAEPDRPVTRRFHLQREIDETGMSGTGRVAEGVQLPNGMCVMWWLVPPHSVQQYRGIEDLQHIHGHGAKRTTQVVFD